MSDRYVPGPYEPRNPMAFIGRYMSGGHSFDEAVELTNRALARRDDPKQRVAPQMRSQTGVDAPLSDEARAILETHQQPLPLARKA